MSKLIKHKWKLKIDHKGRYIHQCQICGVKKYYSFEWQRYVYEDRRKIVFKLPECLFPMNCKPKNLIEK